MNAFIKPSLYFLSLLFLTTRSMEQTITSQIPSLPKDIWSVIVIYAFSQATTTEEAIAIYKKFLLLNKTCNQLLKDDYLQSIITQNTLAPLLEKDINIDKHKNVIPFSAPSLLAQAAYHFHSLYLQWQLNKKTINSLYPTKKIEKLDASEFPAWFIKPELESLLSIAITRNQFSTASKRSALPTIKVILQKRANPNLKNKTKEKETPLHKALFAMQAIEIIELLIKSGASINMQDAWGSTPLHYALASKDTSIPVNIFIMKYHSFPIDNQCIAKLLSYNPDLTLKDRFNKTPYDIFKRVCNLRNNKELKKLKKLFNAHKQ
jgi:ankyrin repeat protein